MTIELTLESLELLTEALQGYIGFKQVLPAMSPGEAAHIRETKQLLFALDDRVQEELVRTFDD